MLCGEGKRKRIARCGNPAPENDGKECEGGTRDVNDIQIKIEVESCMAKDENGNPRMCPSKFMAFLSYSIFNVIYWFFQSQLDVVFSLFNSY